MSSDEALVSVRQLGKCYRMYDQPADRLRQMLWGRLRKNPYGREFWAVRDLSLTIRKGETLGLIGRNGSGKSTTLQMIAGTLEPTTGTVSTVGRIGALLELGSGFNPEYSGWDNISLYGSILGIDARRMASKLDDIVAFADIGRFIDQPVKTYSSGMAVRLAFSVAIHVEPDVLIVDEALSVGDARFQQKCLRAIESIRSRAAVLMVTHDLSALRKFCHSAIWMQSGAIRMAGSAESVATAYLDDCYGVQPSPAAAGPVAVKPSAVPPIPAACVDKGIKHAVITHAGFVDAAGNALPEPPPGMRADYRMLVEGRRPIAEPLIVGLTLTNRLGQEVFAINSLWADKVAGLAAPDPGRTKAFRLSFTMPELNHGQYCASPALATGTQSVHAIQHWVHDATVITVPPAPRRCLPGILSLSGYQAEGMS